MIVRYRYRAYPAAAQAEMLARTFGYALGELHPFRVSLLRGRD